MMNAAANYVNDSLSPKPTSTQTEHYQSTTKTMKALAWFGKQNVRVVDVPKPLITDPTDALVRVTGTTVCGSDLHLYTGDISALKSGDILGHEYMGIVEEVGPNVAKIKKGDRVVAAFNIACGNCKYCDMELYTQCDTTNSSALLEKVYGQKLAGVLGYGHLFGGFAGGQAEFVRQPFADTNLFVVPDEIPDEQALFLSDIICTSYHAVVRSGAKSGETIGVWGLGPIGLMVFQWLHVIGVARIIAIDNVPERLSKSVKYGAEPLNFDGIDVVNKIYEMCPEGLDRAIDCAAFRYAKSMAHKVQRFTGLETDTSENLNEMIRSTRKFGTIALIADYVGTTNGLLIGPVMEKGISLIGCGQAPVQKYIKECMGYIQQGKFEPLDIVTHRFRFEEIASVYERFHKKEAGILKVFLETQYSSPASKGAPTLTSVMEE